MPGSKQNEVEARHGDNGRQTRRASTLLEFSQLRQESEKGELSKMATWAPGGIRAEMENDAEKCAALWSRGHSEASGGMNLVKARKV